MKAENSESFDVGIEKSFSEYGLNFDLTYFNIKYDNVLEGWKTIIVQVLPTQHKI